MLQVRRVESVSGDKSTKDVILDRNEAFQIASRGMSKLHVALVIFIIS